MSLYSASVSSTQVQLASREDRDDGFLWAVSYDLIETVRLYLENGANPLVQEGKAFYSCVINRNPDMLRLLLAYSTGKSILHLHYVERAQRDGPSVFTDARAIM